LEIPLYLKAIMDAEFLRTVSILRQLNTTELESFSSLLTLNEVKPRQRLTEEGTPVLALSIICTGVVHIRRLAQKREMLLGRLGPATPLAGHGQAEIGDGFLGCRVA
jgi:signal-transduction protein with cAMP-binding, CBS, and nucleotidyltransferase domain